jgi:hypothetical protein
MKEYKPSMDNAITPFDCGGAEGSNEQAQFEVGDKVSSSFSQEVHFDINCNMIEICEKKRLFSQKKVHI